MSALMIVESSIKAKEIAKYFPDMVVRSTVGHIRELPVKEMGVYSPDFEPEYQIISKKSNVVGELKKAAKCADVIYLATDLDREGEAIAWHVNQILDRASKRKTVRISYNEVSKQAIETAIENATKVNTDLVRAQEARRVIDRFVGYIVSPELNKLLNRRGLSAGRVQSAAVKILCAREAEIKSFVPKDHFGLRVFLKHEGVRFYADWNFSRHLNEGEKLLLNKDLALEVRSRTQQLQSLPAEEHEKKIAPPKTLVTSELIQAASKLFRATAKETMKAAQHLFNKGLITYHRTDSHFTSPEFVSEIRSFATKNQLPVSKKPRTASRRKNAQEAHECIRVASFEDKSSVLSQLDELERKLYPLIFYRTLCSQLDDSVETHRIQRFVNGSDAIPGGDEFVSKTISIKSQGWRAAERYSPAINKKTNGDEGVQRLPQIEPFKNFELVESEIQTKTTKPPGRYTEATLVKQMESTGIGRPSTYASIIETLINRRYAKRVKANFHPTELGKLIFELLDGSYQFMCLDYTAELEEAIDRIASGTAEYLETVKETYQRLQEETSTFASTDFGSRISAHPNAFSDHPSQSSKSNKQKAGTHRASNKSNKVKSGDQCSSCTKGKHALRTFKNGKNVGKQYFGCTNFPDCRFFQWAQ